MEGSKAEGISIIVKLAKLFLRHL